MIKTNIMIKKLILLLGLLLLLSSCKEDKSLGKSPAIMKLFNKTEMLDLEKILTFFDNQIFNKFKSKSLVQNYSLFYEKSLMRLDSGEIYLGFSYEKQNKLILELKESTFKKIWNLGKSYNKKDTTSIVNLKVDGNYIKFLKTLGKENIAIKKYVDDLIFNYDITPSQSYFFINNYESINIKDERIRLMIAIHYLTLNNIYGGRE